VRIGDLGSLSASVDGTFDAVLLIANLIDIYDDGERRAVLESLRELIAPDGLLIFSSHNLGSIGSQGPAAGGSPGPLALLRKLVDRPPVDAFRALARLPRRARNRRRLAPLVYRATDHAILNDEAHDYSLLHYYIGRDDQERQLAELGYELVESLDRDGRPAGPGDRAPASASLHYIARAAQG